MKCTQCSSNADAYEMADNAMCPNCLLADNRKLRRELKALRKALSMIGPPICESLHHEKKDHHKSSPCPVEARIRDLIREGGALE